MKGSEATAGYTRITLNSDFICEAAKDFFYLVNRGYSRKQSLELVTARYGLSKVEKLALYRSIFPREVAASRRKRLAELESLGTGLLVVDAFNQVGTVSSALLGDVLVVGNDGIVRDLAAGYRRISFSPLYVSALYVLLSYLSRLGVERAVFVFDSQVSFSARFAGILKSFASLLGHECWSIISPNADNTVIQLSEWEGAAVATSDSVILEKTKAPVVDVAKNIVSRVSLETVVDLGECLDDEVE
ncbi:DUF434 domain-containing protein [Thermofilum pendens]|uniref:DUF434 domain-containing protein n=1 Tax=Thermofilum pendens (strain DSM 2475 / Hrk 5) TaxID=368408 RepID=A1RWQ0_THEPD|nr:DUF434 domain-containing protein [Thermofilum pendens]ABL77630.1 protein of unknown function DUF434 [Thermofilum pendens Hrk 5]